MLRRIISYTNIGCAFCCLTSDFFYDLPRTNYDYNERTKERMNGANRVTGKRDERYAMISLAIDSYMIIIIYTTASAPIFFFALKLKN